MQQKEKKVKYVLRVSLSLLLFLMIFILKCREYGYEDCDMMVQSRDPVNSVGRVMKMMQMMMVMKMMQWVLLISKGILVI
ncbi:hypothetical protein HanXRQr2_Chr05g0234731 [Helianthus annuus]|uniref:Transmembrane protein n=1 Tax=Helianthus annuus TaxID=4232 RepID=A0A9K3NP60_HELAN|nr:hypothetical protein HanXRQr2_Chr05g0234731 [Helianthus annuus]KAJ0586021.1 hypothetical protein HanHA89_Chr05g0207291 [Helianthus annuus]KAJ0748485.1 hypothetical protein HanOQP8_Chr05g0201691 [Helianthus annuus]KAJ0924288.1 hypothetical protein HanPSC8_Chr05g0226501 [Helianthus annuus]